MAVETSRVQPQQLSSPGAIGGGPPPSLESLAVPKLKVMRLQKPDLDTPTAGTLDISKFMLGTALCLPNSFGVIHVGETFTAYLGAINTSKTVAKITVTAQLQTPSQRWQLASRLDEGNAAGGVEVLPDEALDAIVSHLLEEVGQHILRVEVEYGGNQPLRKFFRFQVSNPLFLSEQIFRAGDSSCFVSISLENNGEATKQGLTIASAQFEPASGLIAEQVESTTSAKNTKNSALTGVSLFDKCGRLGPGEIRNYLFKVTIPTPQSPCEGSTKGIAAGDELGKAIFTWRKACGESGRMASSPIICPMIHPNIDPNDPPATMRGDNSDFVVHVQGSSCLSVDVATMAAARAANPSSRNVHPGALDLLIPVTVEPINPPKRLKLGIPFAVKFLIVNHSDKYLTLQLQFQTEHMKGILVCGPSFTNLEEVAGNGGSLTVVLKFIALTPGLLQLRGCNVVDLATGHSIPQPPLFNAFAEAVPGE
jgi:trafficking protein particle complex subunit 13